MIFGIAESVAASVCSEAAHRRLDVQIGPNGTLPLEDRRTKSENYHAFDSIALLGLAAACRKCYGHQFPGGDADFLCKYTDNAPFTCSPLFCSERYCVCGHRPLHLASAPHWPS